MYELPNRRDLLCTDQRKLKDTSQIKDFEIRRFVEELRGLEQNQHLRVSSREICFRRSHDILLKHRETTREENT